LKLTQTLGAILLHLRAAANTETGDSIIYGREFLGV